MADDAAPNEAGADRAVVDEPLLARVPESVVALGAGALATSTLITLVGTLFVGYSVATAQFYGYQPYQLFLAGLQFFVATAFQAIGVYFARQRVRWTWVMLAAILGSLAFITLPFTVVAALCIGLGKYHFALSTPADVIRGDEK